MAGTFDDIVGSNKKCDDAGEIFAERDLQGRKCRSKNDFVLGFLQGFGHAMRTF